VLPIHYIYVQPNLGKQVCDLLLVLKYFRLTQPESKSKNKAKPVFGAQQVLRSYSHFYKSNSIGQKYMKKKHIFSDRKKLN